ncbi:MAG: bifunctional 23S rRNA (guanine(2069)-N(7))-methyltransferase RlmK/23S rRNA (guanine(2445)-N(2))-methyltransferase RlmL, partial [Pseudomonadota bacterium]
MTATTHRFVATVPRGFSDLLALELAALGAERINERAGGVSFEGPLATGYRACLESRLASRVLMQVATGPMHDAQTLYDVVHSVDWREHMDPQGTLACEFTGLHPSITNSHFGALKVKDGICDQLRDTTGGRPTVQTARPDLRVHAHVNRSAVAISIDLAGESLSRRGYRIAGGEAPLRENVAAGILLRAQWPAIAADGGEFLDPMCGSGTFVIEAAWMAAGIAPGLMRDYFGFFGWRGHDAALWARLREAALDHMQQTLPVTIRGTDRSNSAVTTSAANARRAGVGRDIQFTCIDIADVKPATVDEDGASFGLMCVNPPYGLRIGQGPEALEAHRAIGAALRERFAGWQAAVLTGEPQLGQEIGVNAHRTHTVFNGAIECRLLRFAPGERAARRRSTGIVIDDEQIAQSKGAQMFANRLRKNQQQLLKLARRQHVSCLRLYDADMPEYSLAIDLYAGHPPDPAQRWLFVQEYAPPDTVDPVAAKRRREEALSVLPEVTGVPFQQIQLRTRRKQKGASQYDKLGARGEQRTILEGGLKFLVNFDDYLDTGLFLDHRLTRQRVRDAAQHQGKGRRFLNLFAYTGSVSVYAAAGGAASTTTVDLSRTYLDWAQRNLTLNGFAGPAHVLVHAECLAWLAEAVVRGPAYELIFLDPPTFSNSARMDGVLDVQRDHARLIEHCMSLLTRDGLLLFSTNAQRFALDSFLSSRYVVTDITKAT